MSALSEQPEIKIDDLVVRPWQSDDAEAVYQACQDPTIHRWTTVPRPYEMAHAVGFVGDLSTDAWAARSAANFGVFAENSGELLGSMGLVRLDLAGREAELGYWTAPAARGRGVATRAGRAVAQWATDLLGIERLVWRAEVGNHASRLVALRIGFTMEGLGRGNLRHADGSRLDGWTGALYPGEVISATPAELGPGSLVARRAAAFGQPQPVLRFDGGLLRPLTDDDVPALVEACRDPETVRWIPIPDDYQPANARHFINVLAAGKWTQGTGAEYVIADADGTYLGAVGLSIDTDDPASGEIGFQVTPAARGRGLASAATRTLCEWAFDSLGLTRIVWRAQVGNDASRRVAEKVGFTFEGTQRRGLDHRGNRLDAWIASLVASDPR